MFWSSFSHCFLSHKHTSLQIIHFCFSIFLHMPCGRGGYLKPGSLPTWTRPPSPPLPTPSPSLSSALSLLACFPQVSLLDRRRPPVLFLILVPSSTAILPHCRRCASTTLIRLSHTRAHSFGYRSPLHRPLTQEAPNTDFSVPLVVAPFLHLVSFLFSSPVPPLPSYRPLHLILTNFPLP